GQSIMTLRDIRKAASPRPFRPFTLHLSSGQAVEVLREEYIALHPKAKSIVVFAADGDYHIIDLSQIASIQAE
ncbi:MAG: hypothetical protein L0Z50_05755, partial [Verrucomicrobiales bacterium]|nr:hypothetical protein [Verrucomicrobiales bacterium]